MIDTKEWPTIRNDDIVVLPQQYIPNPEVYASFQAYAFIEKMLDERKKLLLVLKEARLSIALEKDHVRLGEWTALNCLGAVVWKCDDIKTEVEG